MFKSVAVASVCRRVLICIVACATAVPALAPTRALAAPPNNSLALVPADAGVYLSLLRNKQQYDLVAESRWLARLKEMPAFQQAWEEMQTNWSRPGGPGEGLSEFLKDPDNRELAELGLHLTYDEVFLYADETLADALDVYQEASWAGNFAMYESMLSGDFFAADSSNVMVRAWLDVLLEHKARVRVPKVIIGMKIRDEDLPAARKQLERLTAVRELLGVMRPELKERMKKVEIDGSSFWTLELEGADYDWSTVPLDRLEDKYRPVVEHVKELKLSVSVGIHKGYVLISLGPTNEHLAELGKGMLLVDRPELAPVRALADKQVTQIAFMSGKYQSVNSYFNRDDLDTLARRGKQLVMKAPLDLDLKLRIQADVDAAAADLKRFSPDFGPAVSVSFLSQRGFESFSYNWSKFPSLPAEAELEVLRHVGGSPLFVAAGATPLSLESYELAAKWYRKINGYVNEFAVAAMSPDDRDRYDVVVERTKPLIERFDKITREKLLPSLAGGQTAIVVDAKLGDKLWFEALPPADGDLKLVQPALVMTVRDGKQAAEALEGYRKLAGDLIATVRELAPDAPDEAVEIPTPTVKDTPEGKLYVFSLPENLGASKRLGPNYGVSEKVLVFSVAPEHSAQLLKPTPPKLDMPPGDLDRKLLGLVHVDVRGLTDAIVPWVETTRRLSGAEDDDDERKNAEIVVELLRAVRGLSASSWREGDVLVTHGELRVSDLAP